MSAFDVQHQLHLMDYLPGKTYGEATLGKLLLNYYKQNKNVKYFGRSENIQWVDSMAQIAQFWVMNPHK